MGGTSRRAYNPRPKFGGITPQKTIWYYAARRQSPPIYGAAGVYAKYFGGPESAFEYIRDNWNDFNNHYWHGR